MTFEADSLASPEYRATLRKRYESAGWGASGYGWAPVVRSFADDVRAKSILDYGCGRGTLKTAMLGWDVREYDPGVVGKDSLPDTADLVVCTDVLEHIEPTLLGNVLSHIAGLAVRGVFINVGLGPAKEVLPDGRNAHLIQRPPEWWRGKLCQHGLTPSYQQVRKGYSAWVIL